jgi:hypothetical protein
MFVLRKIMKIYSHYNKYFVKLYLFYFEMITRPTEKPDLSGA